MVPKISVVIVNFNGKKWLTPCLNSLLTQNYKKFEIIVVDNDSTDGSVNFLKKQYPEVRLIRNKSNLGYAGGCNSALPFVTGSYVLILNNDTIVEKNFLSNFIKAFEEIPNLGVAQSKIILLNKETEIDTCGSYWTNSTFLYHYGNGKNGNLPIYNKPFPVFSIKGASILIKKEIIEKVGLFDGDFWCYYEETDFCHRVWMNGFECWYWPNASILHAAGGTSLTFKNSFIQFHNFKNKLLSFLKNFELRNLLWILPTFVLMNVFISLAWIFQGKIGHAGSLYKAIWWNIIHYPLTLKKRKETQKIRVKTDDQIMKICKKTPGLSYYIYLFKDQIRYYRDR